MTSHASGPPPFAITLDVGSSLANKTGSWRTERPEYVRMTAPCGGACPAAVPSTIVDLTSDEPRVLRQGALDITFAP